MSVVLSKRQDDDSEDDVESATLKRLQELQRASETMVTISSEESSFLLPEDIASDNIMSTCSDAGETSQESCLETFRQITQPMSPQQNLSNENTSVDTDLYSEITENTGMYNLDYILCQFNEFFRSRLDSELEAFQDIMHSILTEQQIHIQRIISSSIEQNLTEECNETADEVPVESNENSTETSEKRSRSRCKVTTIHIQPDRKYSAEIQIVDAHVTIQRAKLKWV